MLFESLSFETWFHTATREEAEDTAPAAQAADQMIIEGRLLLSGYPGSYGQYEGWEPLRFFHEWGLGAMQLPEAISARPREEQPAAMLDYAAEKFLSPDPQERFDATRLLFNLEMLWGASSLTRDMVRHLVGAGEAMAPVAARHVGAGRRTTRSLASMVLAHLAESLEPCIPNLTRALEQHPADAAFPLLFAGKAGDTALASAFRSGPQGIRLGILFATGPGWPVNDTPVGTDLFEAIVDCLGELEPGDDREEAHDAIVTALENHPERRRYLQLRYEESEGEGRALLDEALWYLARYG